LPLKQLLAPAIKLAKQGFTTSQSYQRMASFRLKALQNSPAAAAIFLKNNAAPEPGTNIVQKDLASTLQKIAQQGNAGFYSGQTASQLVNGSNAAGGIWQLSDLSQYQVKERQPIQGNYRGLRITSAPPPSSGGIAMLTILNILEGFELAPQSDSLKTHLIIESMRRAYRDRAIYLGDPDFNNIPTDMLTDKHYAAGLRASMREDRATQSDNLPGIELPEQARDTTHFSIVDNQGNRVAATLSINYPFGSCFVAPGTGVLLNDEMDDFVAKPGIPNAYGLVGAQANAIEAGKRPLSSMSPTFIDSDQGFAVIGTPGGSRIITMVLLGLLNYQQGKDAMEIVSAPRFHHQFLPDTVFYEEKAFSDTTIAELERMGHVLKQAQFPYGNMQVVIWSNITKKLTAASDPRGIGAAIVK
jgi:gamma-glutamyltranspeptidase/glutathione hydrolase